MKKLLFLLSLSCVSCFTVSFADDNQDVTTDLSTSLYGNLSDTERWHQVMYGAKYISSDPKCKYVQTYFDKESAAWVKTSGKKLEKLSEDGNKFAQKVRGSNPGCFIDYYVSPVPPGSGSIPQTPAGQ